MLPFGGFPIPWRDHILGSPIQVSSVLRLHAPTRGGIAACRALLRLSSRAILQTAWHVQAVGGVCLAFGEITFQYVYGVVVFDLCMVSFWSSRLLMAKSVHPSPFIIKWRVASYGIAITHFCWIALEAIIVNIRVMFNVNADCWWKISGFNWHLWSFSGFCWLGGMG